MANTQLWINSYASFISIIVAYVKYYIEKEKTIKTFADSFGWVCGVNMCINGIMRSVYYFSKNQPIKWSASVAFLNIAIGAGIIYSILMYLYSSMTILLYISGAWFIFESMRIYFEYHKQLKISPASPVLFSNLIFGISIIIFVSKYNKIDDS